MAKILYLGYGRAGLECLLQLLNEKEVTKENIFIVTYENEDNKLFLDFIKLLGLKFDSRSIKEKKVCDNILKFQPDLILSIYFRDIIPDNILNHVKAISINLHPSLLPKYKGCFSAPWTIINEERKTGITYHYLTSNIDSGNIILQEEIFIRDLDTAYSLYNRLISLGVKNFSTMFELSYRQKIKGEKQDKLNKIYKRQIPFGGFFSLEWSRKEINNFIRAMYFPPKKGAQLKYKGKVYEFLNIQEFNDFCLKNNIIMK